MRKTTTLAATLFGPEDLRMIESDLAPLAPGMVRLGFGAAGICGSDMHYFRHARTGDFVVKSPLVLGHEIAGTVLETGEGVEGLRAGTRVSVNPSRWCGTCRSCAAGRPNLCENIYFMGSASRTPHMQGGFATVFDAVPAQCVPIPDHVSFEAAALAEPLAVALHAAGRAGTLPGGKAFVLGAGPIGLLTMLAAHSRGMIEVDVADIEAAPLAFAARLGAAATHDLAANPEALAGAAYEVVFEATGAPAGLAAALRAVRRGGIVVQIGNLPGGTIPVPANAIMAKEIDLRGSFRFGGEFHDAVRMIAEGAIDVAGIISARRPLASAPDALRLALDRSRSMKVVLVAGAAEASAGSDLS